MKSQKDTLLDLLASDIDFKAEVTLFFDTRTALEDVPLTLTEDERETLRVAVLDALTPADFATRGYVPYVAGSVTIPKKSYRAYQNDEGQAKSDLLYLQDDFEILKGKNRTLKKQVKDWEGKAKLAQAVKKPRGKTYGKQLTDEQVWDIRDHIKMKRKDAAIVKRMGGICKDSAIWRIRKGLAYSSVGERPHSSTQKNPTTVRAGHGVIA